MRETVLAVGLSERHDRDGNPLGKFTNGGTEKTGRDDCRFAYPSECPSGEVTIEWFNAEPVNGAIALSYLLNIPEGICPNWIHIVFTRTSTTDLDENGNQIERYVYHNGGDIPVVYDSPSILPTL